MASSSSSCARTAQRRVSPPCARSSCAPTGSCRASSWDSTYVPLAHGDWLRAMTADVEFDPTVWWLAERDRVGVGCALWWSSGWLKDVVVRESERGRGLGTALVRQGFAEFARRGVRRVG